MPAEAVIIMPIARYCIVPPEPEPGRMKMKTMASELSAIGSIVITFDAPLCCSGSPGGSWSWISPSGISGPGLRATRWTSSTPTPPAPSLPRAPTRAVGAVVLARVYSDGCRGPPGSPGGEPIAAQPP